MDTQKLEAEIKKLKQQITDISNRVRDLETIRNPDEIAGKVVCLEQQQDEIRTAISETNIKLNAYLNDDKYIELFEDDEFKNLYMGSGLVAKDVAKIMKQKFPELDNSAPAISKIVNGQIGNLKLRSYLGKIFRYEISKRNK